MAEIKLTKNNFENEVIKSEIPVIVDFWATWCGPCMMLSSIIAEIAKDYEGKIKVGKLNVDEEHELAAQYNIESIPTVMLINNGVVEKISVGYRPKEDILKEFGL